MEKYIAEDDNGNVVCRWERSAKPDVPDGFSVETVDSFPEIDYWADWTGV